MIFSTEEIKKILVDYEYDRKDIPAGWIYLGDNTVRYVLGQPVNPKQEPEQKNLLIIGVNPSTAKPKEPDNTIKRVIGISQAQGYDGWIMVNIYPQRATNPKNMTPLSETILKENIEVIRYIIEKLNIQDVWYAWGDLIDKAKKNMKDILKNNKKQIDDLLTEKGIQRYHYSTLTKKGNPRHPLMVPNDDEFYKINVSTSPNH